MTELEAIDLEEAELLDPAQERIGQPLHDEEDPRRPGGRELGHGVETAERVGKLETPGVGIHHAEKQALVGREVEGDQRERSSRIQPDKVDRGLAEKQARVDDLQAGLDTLYVVGDQLL